MSLINNDMIEKWGLYGECAKGTELLTHCSTICQGDGVSDTLVIVSLTPSPWQIESFHIKDFL